MVAEVQQDLRAQTATQQAQKRQGALGVEHAGLQHFVRVPHASLFGLLLSCDLLHDQQGDGWNQGQGALGVEHADLQHFARVPQESLNILFGVHLQVIVHSTGHYGTTRQQASTGIG